MSINKLFREKKIEGTLYSSEQDTEEARLQTIMVARSKLRPPMASLPQLGCWAATPSPRLLGRCATHLQIHRKLVREQAAEEHKIHHKLGQESAVRTTVC
jgi:hypothetical protein